MITIASRAHTIRFSAAAVLASLLLACGGGQKKADEPDNTSLLEPDTQGEQAPSSEEVKRAIDLIKAENFSEAATILEKETKNSPEDPQAAFFYGVSLENTDRQQEAIGWYKKAIQLQPKLLEASHNLSALLLEQEDFAGALAVVDEALKIAPEEPGLLANRAISLDMLQKPEAIGAYEAYLKVKPDDQPNRFNYAVALALNGREADAKKVLSEIKTTDVSLLGDVGALYMKLGDPPGCIKLWDSVLASNKTAEGLVHRARCKLGSGDKKGGMADLKDAVATDDKSSVAHFYLGVVLKKEGKAADGKKHLQKAIEVGGGDEFAQAAKKALSE
jgi:tetratricopeptide (TPR) repeat protein